MPIDITMPALSPTMEEGTLAKWHVKEGDTVSSGDVIAEIETDKATMEVEAVDEGRIGKIVVPAGTEGVKVNAVIAVLLQEGESADAAGAASAPPPKAEASKSPAATPPSAPQAQPQPQAAASTSGNGSGADRQKSDAGTLMYDRGTSTQTTVALGGGTNGSQPGQAEQPARSDGGRVFASPLARRLAREGGIDLKGLTGSGPHGRIVKADIEAARTGRGPAAPALAPAAAPPVSAPAAATMSSGMSPAQVRALYPEGSYEAVPLDGMRRTVAARLTESKQTVPHFYLTVDSRIDGLLAAREQINASAPQKDGKPAFKLSVNDFVIKAWALALQRVPTANATWAGDAILLHKRSDVAVAVAVPGGLFTPVVRSADQKSLRQISEEVKDLASRARGKKLAPHEYQGGASAVSNLGMYGIKHFAAVINPPHGTILAVGAGEERVFAEKGQVKTGQFMTVTLSCDHRSVDGALGAELLGVFKGLIENPIMMLA